MVGEYPEEIEDLEEDELEEQTEKQQEVYDDLSPSTKVKNDLYSLFKWVIKKRDSSKVGNLLKEELGMLDISVRDCQSINLLADTLGHPAFGSFFLEQGEITLATSASREGWLPELFVSEKKAKTKVSKSTPTLPPPKKKRFFSR